MTVIGVSTLPQERKLMPMEQTCDEADKKEE